MYSSGIPSSSSSPSIIANGKNDTVKPNEKIASNIQHVNNQPNSLTINNISYIPMRKIASFCSFQDIYNLRTIGIPSCIDEVYSSKAKDFHNSLKEWMKSAPAESEGNYALAIKIIMDCINNHKDYLDLSDLHLDSLSDLSQIDYIKRLDYRGNNPKEIKDCFIMPKQQKTTLKDASKLPKGIETVKCDVTGPAFENAKHLFHTEIIRDEKSPGKFLRVTTSSNPERTSDPNWLNRSNNSR